MKRFDALTAPSSIDTLWRDDSRAYTLNVEALNSPSATNLFSVDVLRGFWTAALYLNPT